MRTGEVHEVGLGEGGIEETRLENYVVAGLIDFDDVSYDDNADLLFNLAEQVVKHLRTYLPEEKISRVLRFHQKEIARFVHAQMADHYWEDAAEYEAEVRAGFSSLKESAYSAPAGQSPLNFKVAPPDIANIGRYIFGGFEKCLYAVQKFQSDTERQFAVIVDRDSLKWFRPAKGQFQIFYKLGHGDQEYQPDFVAESEDHIYMLETKARRDMELPEVLAKKAAAIQWCEYASRHAKTYGGKPWAYVMVPHDVVAENMTLKGFASTQDTRKKAV